MDSRDRWNDFDEAYATHKRMLVVSIVVALHFAALTAWLMQPPSMPAAQHNMEVTVSLESPVTLQPDKPPAKIVPIQPRVEIPAPTSLPVEPALQQNSTPNAPAPVEQTAPVVEPDYKAAYLNNRLTYPLVARRMGLQGRVILNVEVLDDGMPGQINLQLSSGHDVLDKAALESVKSWRFIPAQRAGQPFTKWFQIPIQFSLKGNES